MDIVFYDYINIDLPKEHFCKKENKKRRNADWSDSL